MTEWIVSSSVLIVIVALLRQVLKGKISLRLQYALWALVLIRLLVPFSFGVSKFSVTNAVREVQTQQVEITVDIPPSKLTDEWRPELAPSITQSVDEEGNLQYTEDWDQWEEDMDSAWEEYKAENTRYVTLSAPDILRIAWVVGMAVMALWLLIFNVRFWLRLQRSRHILKYSPPPVYVTGAVETPCLFGLFHPGIYVTPEVAEDKVALGHVLAHEETHYRHKDHVWSVLRCVCLVLHWYNPLVWLAAALSRRDAELACDESTIRRIGEEERAAYGRTLIGLTCAKRGGLLRTATTMTGSKKSIKERIILIAKKPRMKVYTLIAVILIAAVAVGCTYTGRSKTPEEGFVEWVETLEDETWSQTVRFSTLYGGLQEEQCTGLLLPVLRGITEDDFLDEPVDDNGLQTEYYLYAKGIASEKTTGEWSFSCLTDGTVYVSANYDIAERYNFKEPRKLNCPELYDFIMKTVDEYAVKDEQPADTELTPEIEQMLKQAYAEYVSDPGRTATAEDVWIEQYYGKYGNSHVTLIHYNDQGYLQAVWTEVVDGVEFTCPDSRRIRVYTGSGFCTLTEAFEQGLLTRDDLERIAELHRNRKSGSEPAEIPSIQQIVNSILVGGLMYDDSWQSMGSFTLTSTAADGRVDTYVSSPRTFSSLSSMPGNRLEAEYEWTEIDASRWTGLEGNKYSLRFANDRYSVTVYSNENKLELQANGITLYFVGTPVYESYGEFKREFSDVFYEFRQYAEDALREYEYAACWVDGSETDYDVIAQRLAEQYARIILQRPGWAYGQALDVQVRAANVFDAYYGADNPNFCFGKGLYLKVTEDQRWNWEVGSGLEGPFTEGPYAGYYGHGLEVDVRKKADGNWHMTGMGTGGSMVSLPVKLDDATVQQLMELYFLTDGHTHDWRIIYRLAEKPLEEVAAQLKQLESAQRRELTNAIAALVGEYPDYAAWSAAEFEVAAKVTAIMGNTEVYRCEGDDPYEAAVELITAYVEDLMAPDDLRSFTITAYRNLAVEIEPTLEMSDAAISHYIYGLSQEEIGEDTWIVEFNMEYRFEGVLHGPPVGPSTGLPEDYWVELVHQGSPLGFLLTRNGDEFTLQSRYDIRY